MKTVLLATDRRFWLDDRGDRRRIAALCRFITGQRLHLDVFFVGWLDDRDRKIVERDYGEVTFHPPLRKSPGEPPPTRMARTIGKLRQAPQALLRSRLPAGVMRALGKLWRSLRSAANPILSPLRPSAAPSGKPGESSPRRHTLAEHFSCEVQATFRTLCAELSPDFIIVEYLSLAYLVEGLRPHLPTSTVTMIDTIDLMSARHRMFQEAGISESLHVSEDEEKRALEQFDVILSIQRRETSQFKTMLPRKKVITVGHVSEILRHEPRDEELVNLMYVGSAFVANRRALHWFLENVWDALYDRFPDKVRLVVVGSICEYLSALDPAAGVTLEGYVDDLRNAYSRADIIVNPTTFGTGLKIKNVEALCNGKSLVTTSVGAHGLEHGAGDAFFVCDTPKAMIEKLCVLIDDINLRRETSEKAYRFALANFTEESAYAELLDVFTGKPPRG